MALTRKFLSAMGIEADKIDQIIEAHTEVTDALKKERDNYQEKATELESVQKELNDYKKKVADYEKASSGKDSWESKYNQAVADKTAAEKAFNDYKAEIASKELAEKKKTAYKNLLKEMKVSEKRLDAILKVTDLSKMEFDKDGKVKDADKLKETIKSDWSDFITTKEERGANTATPPAGTDTQGSSGGKSHAAQLAARYHSNLYGAKKED